MSKLMMMNEENVNALTHVAGAIAFIIMAPFLLAFAQVNNRIIWPVAAFLICLILMYMNSAVYHSVSNQEVKRVLRIMDHVSIYLLIGGTFTPVVVYNMGNWNAMPFLYAFWITMLLGVIFKLFYTGRFKLVSTLIYIVVAWAGVIFAWPAVRNMSWPVICCILGGGLFYTAGTYFYMKKDLRYHHGIWHLFVFAGSFLHLIAIRYSLAG